MIEAEGVGVDERLRRIEAVTDSALSRLDVDDLFDELLARVQEILMVDTAAILLLDQHAQQFVTTAAKGVEAETRPGLRISAAHGFVGQVAAGKQPIVVEQVAPADLPTAVLRDRGIRSMLGVPLFAGTDLVGVLHVGTLSPRRFTRDDVQLLQLVADRASLASQARLGGIDRTATLALQRSACSPPGCRRSPASRWPPGTSPATTPVSVATGTTSSPFPQAGSASWSATSPGTGCGPPS
ncbi:GAF domain-containing protein [Micromonospora sp. HM5-17]|uniref:GAF domain-containing protein n=1 Tax=Micromonospora sp. HM5-17 TaxID=2487710 RepID=UPI001F1EEC12|nr:GAF domain-containing protein [Micromonospora sp. HM5-17]